MDKISTELSSEEMDYLAKVLAKLSIKELKEKLKILRALEKTGNEDAKDAILIIRHTIALNKTKNSKSIRNVPNGKTAHGLDRQGF